MNSSMNNTNTCHSIMTKLTLNVFNDASEPLLPESLAASRLLASLPFAWTEGQVYSGSLE